MQGHASSLNSTVTLSGRSQRVKAYLPRMCCRQCIFSRSRGDLYLGGKFGKSPRGELRGPCDELDQPRQLFLRKTSHYCPKPVKSLNQINEGNK